MSIAVASNLSFVLVLTAKVRESIINKSEETVNTNTLLSSALRQWALLGRVTF